MTELPRQSLARLLRVVLLVGPLLASVPARAETVLRFPASTRRLEFDDVTTECTGFDEAWERCDLSPCARGGCVPVDCVFADWGEWYDGDQCTGLAFRHRSIRTSNNECGKPCQGANIESKTNPNTTCTVQTSDCLLSEWTDWDICKTRGKQVLRTRTILRSPTLHGLACKGRLRETMACGIVVAHPQACTFSDWEDWGECAGGCRQGNQMRQRHLQRSRGSSEACAGAKVEFKTCIPAHCDNHNCSVTSWSEWSHCSASHQQRFRTRDLQLSSGSGSPCELLSLKETARCTSVVSAAAAAAAAAANSSSCDSMEFSQWSEWTPCGSSCQITRKRSVEQVVGTCRGSAMQETQPCYTAPSCFRPTEVSGCEYGEWTQWSHHSSGWSERTRTAGNESHSPCVVKEVRQSGSTETTSPIDCQWQTWQTWTDCSHSCGGGIKSRSRSIGIFPRNGGSPCDHNIKAEVIPCNTQPCDQCIDGLWGQWTSWSACSSTCGQSLRVRFRSIALVPDECGKPVTGQSQEYNRCTGPPCVSDSDCKLGDWMEWSSCSRSCFGVRERRRLIKSFATGNGKACDHLVLAEVVPCNPQVGHFVADKCGGKMHHAVDSKISEWTEWGVCSQTCGGGSRKRDRTMTQQPQHGGKPFSGVLSEISPCGTGPCQPGDVVCRDCIWSSWSEWGDCECAGYQERQRHIKQSPNHCGRECGRNITRQFQKCVPTNCKQSSFCGWSDWSSTSSCQGSPHPDVMLHSRFLQIVPEAGDSLAETTKMVDCVGTQVNVSSCPLPEHWRSPVVRIHCVFSSWESWSQASCLGLCERSRNIETMNNHYGRPCMGSLSETKPCRRHCHTSCEFGEWSDWSSCAYAGQWHSLQKHRKRKFEGAGCVGPVEETAACFVVLTATPCKLSMWSEWSECGVTCDRGWQRRNRQYVSGELGGTLCEAALEQVKICNAEPCPDADCIVSEWSSWSANDKMHQHTRTRALVRPASGKGRLCNYSLLETSFKHPHDCLMSAWSAWSTCDGTREQNRSRHVVRLPGKGFKPCGEVLGEVRKCGASQHHLDCQVNQWGVWSACSCEVTIRTRHREVISESQGSGKGCTLSLSEVAECTGLTCAGDCVWGQWLQWSGCSCSCGGGSKTRSRNIELPPTGGGSCEPLVREEVAPCNTGACGSETCIDGAWGEWSAWSPCSQSCEGGTRKRRRKIAVTAKACGVPAVGTDNEIQFCNKVVPCRPQEAALDCQFSTWDEWSACSSPCAGIKRRSRRIVRYARGAGIHCVGGLKETTPCNPALGEVVPDVCGMHPPVDCKLGAWANWESCSATCGRGQHSRTRDIVVEAKHGGIGCAGALEEIHTCMAGPCTHTANVIDCMIGEWGDWAACSQCGQPRKRSRHILQHAGPGGRNCDEAVVTETGECPFECDSPRKTCAWGSWGNWGHCSASCGPGRRSRKRYLVLQKITAAPPAAKMQLLAKYEELHHQAALLQSHNLIEFAAAFVGGFLTLVSLLAIVRRSSSTGRSISTRASRQSEPLTLMSPDGLSDGDGNDTALPLIA